MHVAFIGHDYHRKTGSSRFLLELIEEFATVESWFGAPGRGADWDWAADFDETRYDLIVVFQIHEAFRLLSGRHPNVVFVPMYDAMFWAGAFYWRPAFNHAKTLCLSWALRQEVMRRGAVQAGFQYFPDPARHAVSDDFETLRGILWYRRREITPDLVFGLCEGTTFDRFTVHHAPDPGNEAPADWVAPSHMGRLAVTGWSADGGAYKNALREANVYFAPRPWEGIGMSFLEAMASGHCVVAPDGPTMSEYISHGHNGLLFDPAAPAPLNFATARAIGARARESVMLGHARWAADKDRLVAFLTTPTARLRSVGASVGVVASCSDVAEVVPLVAGESYAEAVSNAATQSGPPWLLCLPPDARLIDAGALTRLLTDAPDDAVAVIGHCLEQTSPGVEMLRRAGDFATSAERLGQGRLNFGWLLGLPVTAATAIRRDAVRRLPLEPRWGDAALLDWLFQAQALGRVHLRDEVVAVCPDALVGRHAGDPAMTALAAMLRARGDAAAIDRLFQGFDDACRARGPSAGIGVRLLRVLGALEQVSPGMAELMERCLRSTALRRVAVRLLRRDKAFARGAIGQSGGNAAH